VEIIAGQLLPDKLLSEFTDDEIGLLILACHYHDLGMVGTEVDNQSPESRERVREEHAVSVGDRIKKHWAALGFPNQTMADVLAVICKGHRPRRIDDVATWENLPANRILGPDKDVRIRMISSVIYAADELHIGEDRATKREEDFLEIESRHSRPHWRRHQAIQGPVVRGDCLCFERTISSTIFEMDLRYSLAKAFTAVLEMKSQIASDGIKANANGIGLTWNRNDIWTSLIVAVCSDLQPRTDLVITADVESLFKQSVKDCVDISHLCKESDNSKIAESLDDLRKRQFLTGDANALQLDSGLRTARYFLEIARKADDLEAHCNDANRSMHEYQLYQSAFGQRYVRDHLKPTFEQRFAVDLTSTKSGMHLFKVLENSPTASRFLQFAKPPESALVQSDLFMFACVAGVFADLVNVPEKILDAQFRQSVDSLCHEAVGRLPEFLLFLKELAIIRKLSHAQVYEATLASVHHPAHPEIKEEPTSQAVTINVSQSFPANRPEWSMGHLLLAQSRANVSIAFKSTAFAPLSVKIDGGNHPITKGTDPVSFGVGPGMPIPVSTVSFRGSIVEDAGSKTIRLEFGKIEHEETKRPLLLQFSPDVRDSSVTQGSASCKFSTVETDLSVNDIVLLARLEAGKGWKSEVYILGNLLSSKQAVKFGFKKPTKVVKILHEIDPQFSVPAHISTNHFSLFERAKVLDSKEIVDGILGELSSSKPTITSLFLRYATIEGDDYYEEYLGFFPGTFGMRFDETKLSQHSIDAEKVRSGDIEYKVESTFVEGCAELADEIRRWAKDPSQTFPFRLDSEHQSHFGTTRASMTFHRSVDRTWHFERRIVFGFRPMTKSERYGLEMEYWKSQGDISRTSLLSELFQSASLEKDEPKKQSQELANRSPKTDLPEF